MPPLRRRWTPTRRDWPLLVVVVVLAVAVLLLVLYSRRAGPTPAPAPTAVPGVAEVQAYFTTPRYPDDRAAHRGGPDEALVSLMDGATSTLDVAVYDFDLRNVSEAMARAAGRGVRVRMVTDSDTLGDQRNAEIQAAFAVLKQANVPIVEDRRQPIMHHKFTVVDGAWVATGSMNYTDGDAYRLNNNLVIFRSADLARNFTAEFEKMFVNRQFGPSKPAGVPVPRLTLAGHAAESYFSPQDKIANRIVGWVDQAQRSVRFLAFSYTHDGIGDAMLRRAQAGVSVQGVFETTGSNTQFSEFGRLKRAGLDVMQDGNPSGTQSPLGTPVAGDRRLPIEVWQDGNPYVMHEKVIIIDSRRVIFGSYNFSANADQDNDENLIMSEHPDLVRAFEEEFQRVLEVAKNPPRR